MLNRTIQLDVVKKNTKSETAAVPEDNVALYLAAFADGMEKTIFHGTKLIATYMVLDTARKIAINRLSK